MIGYILAIFPLYIFIYLPISQVFFPSSSTSFSSPWHSSSSDDHNDHSFNSSFLAPDEHLNAKQQCPQHRYTTMILSREPLVLYLENWLSESEIVELLEIGADEFSPSHVSTGSEHFIDPSIRLSEVATLPRTPTVRCIEARTRALQGWDYRPPLAASPFSFSPFGHGWSIFGGRDGEEHDEVSSSPGTSSQGTTKEEKKEYGAQITPGENRILQRQTKQKGRLMLERLKIQRYPPGGHYMHHYDWQGGGGGADHVDRVSSFMVYVDANCTGGGTQFPRLQRPRDDRWCRFLECEGHDGGRSAAEVGATEGVTFKPLRGNAVYWENLRADGTGYEETWHAGLPVKTGTKVGLNIWTWYRF